MKKIALFFFAFSCATVFSSSWFDSNQPGFFTEKISTRASQFQDRANIVVATGAGIVFATLRSTFSTFKNTKAVAITAPFVAVAHLTIQRWLQKKRNESLKIS